MREKERKLGLIKRRDWFRILGELDAAGLSNSRVAELLGVAKNTVFGWKMGADPTHALGETLLAFHAARCGAAHAARRGTRPVPEAATSGKEDAASRNPGDGAPAAGDAAPPATGAKAPPATGGVTATQGEAQGGASTGPRALARRAGRRGGMH